MKRRKFFKFLTRGMVAAGYVGAFGLPSGATRASPGADGAAVGVVRVYDSDFGQIGLPEDWFYDVNPMADLLTPEKFEHALKLVWEG